METDPRVIARIYKLEQEVAALKGQSASIVPMNKVTTRIARIGAFIVSYWALISFVGFILTAVYVKFAFNIDYFESYRNASINKNLAEFHRQLGDTMMARAEWKAAQDAYEQALEINPNNTAASYGLVKAQVFNPLEDEKYTAPEVADAKLDYLVRLFPDDYQVYYLKGFRYWDQRDSKNAKEWLNKSIEQNPNFAGGYVMLGYIAQNEADLPTAVDYYEKALVIEPDNVSANNNIGFMHLLNLNYAKAIEYLEKSYSASPKLITAINIGEAYRYAGDANTALAWHQLAQKIVDDPNAENERFIAGEWTYSFMPLYPDDRETIKNYVNVFTLDQKKTIVHYALSLDYALLGNFNAADEALNNGAKLDSDQVYRQFLVNKMESTQNLLKVQGAAQQWLESLRSQLSSR